MEPIFPLHEERINQFCGMPVCIVTTDGQRHVGILSGCSSDRVMLNSPSSQSHGAHFGSQGQGTLGTLTHLQGKDKSRKKKSSKAKKAASAVSPLPDSTSVQTQAWGWGSPFGFGAPFAIDLALIAFLFLLL